MASQGSDDDQPGSSSQDRSAQPVTNYELPDYKKRAKDHYQARLLASLT